MPTGSRPRSSGPSDPASGPPGPADPASGLTWGRLRLGAFLLAGLVVGAFAIFFLDTVAREISMGPDLVVAAPEARNLEPGAPVWIAGVPAGRVTRIGFRAATNAGDRRVLIRAEIRQDAAELLRSDASVAVRAPALLEPAVLAIRPGRAATAFDPSDTLEAVPRTDVGEVMGRTDSLAGRLEELRPLARRLTRRLHDGPGTLAALRGDTATVARLETALRQGREMARAGGRGSASLLAADSTLSVRWRRIRERSGRVAASAREAVALAGELDRLTARLSRLGAGIDSGRGSLGRFVGDEAVQRERALMEARIDSVRAELLVDPLRWLRFRLY